MIIGPCLPIRDVPYHFASKNNPWMAKARSIASERNWPRVAIVVKDDEIVGIGSANDPTPKIDPGDSLNHSARQAVFVALRTGYDIRNADMYLWGSWRLCVFCRRALREAGIAHIGLLEACALMFDSEHPSSERSAD